MGGTELLLRRLTDALPDRVEQVQIILSRPEQVELDPAKPKILWLHDLPLDPASACLRDASYRSQFNKIVFVSNWQQQQYNTYLGIPYSEGIVIKNGVPKMGLPPAPEGAKFIKPLTNGKLKFIYTSTPHRGLALLGAAAEVLAQQRQDWELHVYSSLKIYARDEQDKQFEPLYDRLRKNPCVHYHGTVSNEDVRQAVTDAHVFVYPSIYQETSCMAIQEALMAGCLCITTSLGALIETCGEWAWMMQFHEQPEVLAEMTAYFMNEALNRYSTPGLQQHLLNQSAYYQRFYTFDTRVPQWQSVLDAAITEGPRSQKLVFNI